MHPLSVRHTSGCSQPTLKLGDTLVVQISEGQIEALEAIGMDWLNAAEKNWKRGFSHAEKYYYKMGI